MNPKIYQPHNGYLSQRSTNPKTNINSIGNTLQTSIDHTEKDPNKQKKSDNESKMNELQK